MTAARTSVRGWDPDALAELEDERDILLRDLRELDAQHAGGEIDDAQYDALRDELTARAAEILTAIRRGRQSAPVRERRPRRTALTAAAVVTAALASGWLLVSQLAPRVAPAPPQAATADAASRIGRLATLVRDRPTDVPARIALARLLLAEQDLPAALEQFDAAAGLDERHAEAHAYGGWIAVLTGDTEGGLRRLDRAVAAAPGYPDGHALRGLALMRSGDKATAAEELRRYLDLDPTGPLASQVRTVVSRLEGAP